MRGADKVISEAFRIQRSLCVGLTDNGDDFQDHSTLTG